MYSWQTNLTRHKQTIWNDIERPRRLNLNWCEYCIWDIVQSLPLQGPNYSSVYLSSKKSVHIDPIDEKKSILTILDRVFKDNSLYRSVVYYSASNLLFKTMFWAWKSLNDDHTLKYVLYQIARLKNLGPSKEEICMQT